MTVSRSFRLSARAARNIAALSAACAFALGACTSDPGGEAGQSEGGAQSEPGIVEAADGPHASADRTLGERTVRASASGNETIVDIDLGNVTAGNYSAPTAMPLSSPI